MTKNDNASRFSGKRNRRFFLKWVGLLSLIPLFRLWEITVNRNNLFGVKNRQMTIPQDLTEGVHVFDEIILVKSNENMTLLSSRCTHLGCDIIKGNDHHLVCPCHGSGFDLRGKPIKGPAIRPLKQIDFKQQNVDNKILISYEI